VRSHEWIDRRSLALHEAIAAKIEGDPQLLDVARGNLKRWLEISQRPALLEWQRRLDDTPVPQLIAFLRSRDEDAARLRQSSPFAGLLSCEERRHIFDRYDASRP
jgi:hypothetical protein